MHKDEMFIKAERTQLLGYLKNFKENRLNYEQLISPHALHKHNIKRNICFIFKFPLLLQIRQYYLTGFKV